MVYYLFKWENSRTYGRLLPPSSIPQPGASPSTDSSTRITGSNRKQKHTQRLGILAGLPSAQCLRVHLLHHLHDAWLLHGFGGRGDCGDCGSGVCVS